MNYLVNHHQEIYNEAKDILKTHPRHFISHSPNWEDIDFRADPEQPGWIRGWTNDDNWILFQLYNHKRPVDHAKLVCPVTMDLLEKLDEEHQIYYAAFFRLNGKSGIPKHIDINDNCISVQLGLDVPEKCYIISNKEFMHQKTGEIVIYDQHSEHNVFNGSDKESLVLYILLNA